LLPPGDSIPGAFFVVPQDEQPKTGGMSGEIEDGPETSSRGAGWGWLCWLGVIPVLYFLSTGPVARLYEKKLIGPGRPGWRIIEVVYQPVEWACEPGSPLRKPFLMYLHLWVPERLDSQGNPK